MFNRRTNVELAVNGGRYTLGLRSVALCDGQTGVIAYVMLSVLNFFVRGFLKLII